jgi:hypothetical protein
MFLSLTGRIATHTVTFSVRGSKAFRQNHSGPSTDSKTSCFHLLSLWLPPSICVRVWDKSIKSMSMGKALMRDSRFLLLNNRKFLIGLLASILFTGCTSLESRLTIEPYTKNKTLRNTLEDIAEAYCQNKRSDPKAQPDFIFTTDGCSRWPGDSWNACCIAHDIAYWCGGSERDREEADQELMRCVNGKTHGLGSLFYAGVRLGGLPWLPTPWRWGYGWDNWPAGYEKPQFSPPIRKLYEENKVYETIEQQLQGSGR